MGCRRDANSRRAAAELRAFVEVVRKSLGKERIAPNGPRGPSRPHQPTATEGGTMATRWQLKGSYFETCNCEAACPCKTVQCPSVGGPRKLRSGGTSTRVASTTLRSTDSTWRWVAHSPGHMLQTKWKVALYLDSRASAAQADALTQVFSGRAGGLMRELSSFIGEVAGVRNVPIDYRAEGHRRREWQGHAAHQSAFESRPWRAPRRRAQQELPLLRLRDER